MTFEALTNEKNLYWRSSRASLVLFFSSETVDSCLGFTGQTYGLESLQWRPTIGSSFSFSFNDFSKFETVFFVKVSSVKSRSATPTRIPNLAAPRLTIFQDGVGE